MVCTMSQTARQPVLVLDGHSLTPDDLMLVFVEGEYDLIQQVRTCMCERVSACMYVHSPLYAGEPFRRARGSSQVTTHVCLSVSVLTSVCACERV